MSSNRSAAASRSKAAKIIRTLLSRIRRLSCDRSGACTRIPYVDKVFRDLYDVKNFARRSASCRRMSQVVQVFNEIGIKDLWMLLNDETYFEVMSLLVDVQERKGELRKVIRKAQKKLNSSGGTLRVDQKSKQNRRINKSQDELKWLNKRYKDSIESLQENLNINPCGESYKDRFAALKRFSEQGNIRNSWGYDDDDYSYDFNPSKFGRVDDDDFSDMDFDFDEDIRSEKEDRIDRLEKIVSNLAAVMQNSSYDPSSRSGMMDYEKPISTSNLSEVDRRILNMIGKIGRKIDELDARIDDLDDTSDDYEDSPNQVYPYSDNHPSQEDINDMLFGSEPVGYPSHLTESGTLRPHDPSVGRYPSTAELKEDIRHREEAKSPDPSSDTDLRPGAPVVEEVSVNPVSSNTPENPVKKHFRKPIDATNRQDVFNNPTDYQKQAEGTS